MGGKRKPTGKHFEISLKIGNKIRKKIAKTESEVKRVIQNLKKSGLILKKDVKITEVLTYKVKPKRRKK